MNAVKQDERFWAKVDKTETCWLWTGYRDARGYGQLTRQNATIYAHRHALTLAGIDHGAIVDHICHVPSCVRPDHLRAATNKQNSENLTGAYANSKSGIRGVFWDNGAKSWMAAVGHNGSQHRKRFPTLEQAAEWAHEKRLELFTHNDLDRAI